MTIRGQFVIIVTQVQTLKLLQVLDSADIVMARKGEDKK